MKTKLCIIGVVILLVFASVSAMMFDGCDILYRRWFGGGVRIEHGRAGEKPFIIYGILVREDDQAITVNTLDGLRILDKDWCSVNRD